MLQSDCSTSSSQSQEQGHGQPPSSGSLEEEERELELLLEEAAVEAGYEVKIETQGADGIQNRLTAQDIAEATIIIHSVAVTPEDNERFESRDVYEITLQDAIKNAAGIIKEIEEMIASEQQ